jgi:hypothetical protein
MGIGRDVMKKLTVTVEDAKRLLSSTDFAYLSTWYREELAKALSELPQPPLVGIAITEDDRKLTMLDHAFAEIGRRRTK